MPLALNLITPPAAEPVQLSLVKTHLRIDADNTAEDTLITSYMVAARQRVERITHRAIFNQTWQLNLDTFPIYPWWNGTVQASAPKTDWLARYGFLRSQQILLPRPKLVSVTSIKYQDVNCNVQTLDPSAYVVDATSEPGRIIPKPGTTWPATQAYIPGSVAIQFVSGTYGDGSEVNTCPQTIVMAILLLCGHFYEHREAVSELTLKPVPEAVNDLLETEVFTTFGLENN